MLARTDSGEETRKKLFGTALGLPPSLSREGSSCGLYLLDGDHHGLYQFLEVASCSGQARSDHHVPPGARDRQLRSGSQPTANPIASYRATRAQCHYQPHARRSTALMEIQSEPLSRDPVAFPQHTPESTPPAQRLPPPHGSWAQADSRARPLARLFFKIERPARVRMRARKPCFRLPRRLLGWNVRLVIGLPSLSRLTSVEAGAVAKYPSCRTVWPKYSRATFLHVNRSRPETSSRVAQSPLDSADTRLLR